MEKRTVDLIAAEFGWGAKRHETAFGPEALRTLGFDFQSVVKARTPFSNNLQLPYPKRCAEVTQFSQELSKVVATSVAKHHFPIVVGGDHSMAVGTWSGVVSALQAQKQFGLIWVDAHMDSHTVETTPSMAIHGMPLAILLGFGEKKLISINNIVPKLDPKHVVLIGVRSYESGEAELLKSLNVRIFFMDEVKLRGLMSVLKEAIAIVSQQTVGFGVSLDLDAFDPMIAPGVGSPEKEGILSLPEIEEAFQVLSTHSNLRALEIAEYNPVLDIDNKTVDLVNRILKPWI